MNAHVVAWEADWVWSLPLILVTLVVHVCGLGLIYERAIRLSDNGATHGLSMLMFLVRLAVVALLATVLHAIEASVWAGAYIWLGALSERHLAMLYSLNAITSYGHVNEFLQPEWQLMGALEALNGMMLFGLTSAFLFAIIQKIWPFSSRHREGEGRPGALPHRHQCCDSNACFSRRTLARMSAALAVQTKGLGCPLCSAR